MLVDDLLAAKGREVVTVPADAGIRLVLNRLRSNRIGALVVSDDGVHVDGIVSERDLVNALTEMGPRLLDVRARDVMTRNIRTCSATDTVKRVMSEMTRHRMRHLPVLSAGRLVGIVSIGDVVKNRLEEIELESGVLRDAYLATH